MEICSSEKIEKFCDIFIQCINVELLRIRGYGCVTFKTTGSHTDMDHNTFLKSAKSITNSLKTVTYENLKDLNSLRQFGIFVEKNMFIDTNGINTHKGLIFLILFIFREYLLATEFQNMSSSIKDFSKGLVDDYINPKNSAALNTLGINDIRTFPLSGFELVFNFIATIENNLDFWSEDKKTLYLISSLDDTTTIKRSNIQTLNMLKSKAHDALYNSNVNLAIDLDKYYINNKISSGGVADILTVTNVLMKLKGDFYGKTLG